MRKRGIDPVKIIFIISILLMMILTVNVFLVSVTKIHLRSGTDLSSYANSANTVREETKALRGNIYDRNGIIIAEDSRTYNIICILDENRIANEGQITYVADKQYTAEQLAPLLRTSAQTIYEYLSRDAYQTELGTAGRNISEETKNRIVALNLPGIEFTDSIQRVYPLGEFASNLIGFAQSDESGSTVGKMGVELYLNDYLTGTDGYRIYQADKNGYILPGMREELVSSVNGYNITLTLDQEIQETLEESFQMTVNRFNASKVWGSVMEIDTGKILAWGQSPSFDPNTLNITDYNNYGSQLTYEPGSTLKGITWAAAINEGVYDRELLVDSAPYCYGADSQNNPIRATGDMQSYGCIYNANNNEWGMITLDKGLVYSSNTVAAQIQNDLITPAINLEYLKKFGYFDAVRSDGLPEATGTYNFTYPMEKLALSYGQGCSVTMLQMLQAYSAIFSDGTMKRPYYVESIRDAYDNNKVIYQAETKITGEPITASTARTMQEILYKVVNDSDGTAKYYRVDDVDIMGKTGTTQVAINGSYLSGYTIASFLCAIPAENPQVIVYYCFQAPYNKDAHYYTEATQNLIRGTALRLGFAKNVSEEAEVTEEGLEEIESVPLVTGEMPNLINHTVQYAADKLSELSTDIHTLGGGATIIDQYPKAGTIVEPNEKVFLLTDTNGFVMPDMTGWSRKDVTALWQVTQFGFKMIGDGIVSEQNIPAGTIVMRGDQIEVTFE